MNEFYLDLMYPFVRQWIIAHDELKICQNKCKLCIYGEYGQGIVQFHEDNIIELIIQNKETKENIFYLHFQMHDMNFCLKQLNTFFQYLSTPIFRHQDIDLHNTQIKKILLSCTGGLTTSYFAYSIQEIMNQRHLDIQVDAVAYSDIESVADKYDLILLAPQIGYMLPHFREQFGCKVMAIETMDFATSNFEGIVEKAIH